MIPAIEKVLFLKGIDLFSAISGEDLAEIAGIAEELTQPSRAIIIQEGEPGDALYFVVEGKVRVEKGGRQVAELGEREVFGEMALLDAGPRSSTVVAAADVVLLRITRDDFADLMRERPEVPMGVLKVLTRRLRRSAARQVRVK